MRIRINVRGVEADAWDTFKNIREEEQVCLGRLVTEALENYASVYFDETVDAEGG